MLPVGKCIGMLSGNQMMMPVITSLYVGLLGILLFVLSVHTIRQRRALQVALGDQGHPLLKRAVRAHANFAEYVPLILLMLLVLELLNTSPWILHGLGLTLLMGRCCHAWGITRAEENYRWRITGMSMTFLCLLVSAGLLIGHWVVA